MKNRERKPKVSKEMVLMTDIQRDLHFLIAEVNSGRTFQLVHSLDRLLATTAKLGFLLAKVK